MKKKLSMLMVALVALAAFATTMSLQMARRAVSELTVISEATTWDFSSGVTLSSTHEGDLKYTGDDKTTEHIYANIDELTFAETFKADALAFTGEYPFRSNSKKFAQNGTLHFKTSVAGKIVVKFSDTGSSASASAVKRYLVVNGTQTDYWTSRENNGEEGYPAQLNVTTDEIEVPAGDVTIAGSSAIIVSYVSWAPNATPEPTGDKSYTLTFKDSGTEGSDSSSDISSGGSIDVSKILGEEEAAYVSSVSDATKVYLARTGRGLKLGTSSVTGKFTLNLATAVKPTSIVVKARKYNNTQNTIKINGNDFTLSDETSEDCTINYDGNTEVSSIAIEAGNYRAYVISVTVNCGEPGPEPVDPGNIEISPASGDIYAALAEAVEGKEVKSITINLTKDVTYTVSAPLVAPNTITINGNGATIDASALTAAMITTPTGDLAEWLTCNFTVKDVNIKGLPKGLYASAGKNYHYKDFLIDNCVIESTSASGLEFDFRKGGVAENFTINNSTIYAPTATTNSMYTSQSAQKATEAPDVTMQTFTISNSTLYNLAKSKNFFTHRQNSQKWLTFIAKNSIFVNCGKSGQAIKGMNGGGSSANPTWDVVGNAFNYEGADTSAAESTGDADEPIKDNVAGVVTFTDAATGNFSGAFVATEGAFVPGEMPGDPRWTITATASTVPAPEIDGQEKFIGKQNITLSCEMENTKIYYTTDGNDPTIESTLYTEPFEISETTTVKAIAAYVFAGKNNFSEIASKTLTLQTTFATIAELIQLPDGTGFGYTEDVKVVAQAKAGEDTYTYIKDESGATVIFDAGSAKTPAEAVGKKIAKDWVGTVTNYHGVLVNVAPEAALTLTEDAAEEVTYPVVEFGYVDVGHVNEVVMLSGVTYQFVNNEDLTISTMDGETSINAFNKFALNPGYAQKGVEYNIVGAISYETDHVVFVPIEFIEKPTVDITVFPEDGTDISAAIDEASKGHFVRNITINLAAVDGGSAQYTITKSIDAAGCVVINGNGAMIDASALEGPFVLMSTTPRVDPVKVGDNDVFVVDNISFKELAIFGLKNQLFYANKVRYLVRSLSVDNSVIAIDGTAKKTIFDFNGRGNAEELTVKNSTLWAEPSNAQNGGLYSSQSGDGAMDLGGTKQVLSIQNSTLYNIASGKTTCSQRRNDVTGMEFILKNNIIVNCGKVGEFVAGLDGGSYKSKPVWDIQNNAFNVVKYNEDGTFTSQDVSEKEAAKMGNDIVKDSYVGSVYFKNVASGDFAIDAASAAALGNAGDTHWGTYEPTHYTIAVSETALEFADFTVQPFALEDEVVKVDVQEHNGFKMTELIAKVGAQTKLTVTDNSFIMPPANVGIDATFQKVAADYELAPAAGTDIAEALDGLIIRNLKLTLAEGGAYTLTKPIEFSGNLELTGNGATVDASALEAAFVNLAAEPAIDPIVEKKTDEATGETTETILSYPIDNISINGVTIKGLAYQLVKSNNLYLVKELVLDNSVVERLGVQKKSLFDFSGGTGGNVINLTVNKSTLYSDATTQHQNGDFFTSQSSKSIDQMGVDVTAEGFKATTTITNSTFYGIASGKTVSSLRKNSQAYMLYVVKNNVIVNSGKSGQFVKGLNAGSDGAAENYDADTNLFNFNNDVVEETAAKSAENVKNSVNAIVTFKDVEAGDFNMSIFKDPRVAELPAIGDPRWAVTGVTTGYAINIDEAIENGTVTASKSWSAADETIKLTVTPDEGYELESITVKMGAAEIILEEDNSFIMPAADVTVSATFIAVPKLYIIGGPKDWNLADMTELKYNLETQTYELDYAPTATAYFAFADKQFTAEEAAAEGAWDVFNATNRIALGEGDIEATLNEPVDLKKVNGTIILKAGTYKISVTKDLKVTIAGEPAPEPTVEKLFIMGTATAKGWDGTTEMTFNEADQAFEYELENADKIYITFGDAEFTDWGDFNANHRFAIAGGDNVAPVGEEFTLVKVEGTLVLEAGAYKISVTKDLKCKITAVPTGINAIAVDKLDNAVIYNLQGQRVEKSQAKGGVFIVNGKKVAIK